MQEDHHFTSECNGWGCAQQFFLGGKFSPLGHEKNPSATHVPRIFVQKNAPKDIKLQKYSKILKFFYFPCCTQICLIPLVDDCQCGYSTE